MSSKTPAERIAQLFRKPWRTLTSPRYREFRRAYNQFRRDGLPAKRLEFASLNSESVILDLGGFRGEWADEMFARYGATIHVFEPHPRFADELQTKYRDHGKIHVHPVALSSAEGELMLSDTGDGSSAIREGEKSVAGRMVEADAFLNQLGIEHVDLMKVNIEGGEYDILPHLTRTGWLDRITTVQVQFHDLCNGSTSDRNQIRDAFAKSHSEDWCYPFVWEQWTLQAAAATLPNKAA